MSNSAVNDRCIKLPESRTVFYKKIATSNFGTWRCCPIQFLQFVHVEPSLIGKDGIAFSAYFFKNDWDDSQKWLVLFCFKNAETVCKIDWYFFVVSGTHVVWSPACWLIAPRRPVTWSRDRLPHRVSGECDRCIVPRAIANTPVPRPKGTDHLNCNNLYGESGAKMAEGRPTNWTTMTIKTAFKFGMWKTFPSESPRK